MLQDTVDGVGKGWHQEIGIGHGTQMVVDHLCLGDVSCPLQPHKRHHLSYVQGACCVRL